MLYDPSLKSAGPAPNLRHTSQHSRERQFTKNRISLSVKFHLVKLASLKILYKLKMKGETTIINLTSVCNVSFSGLAILSMITKCGLHILGV